MRRRPFVAELIGSIIPNEMFTIEDVQYTGKAVEAEVVAKDGEKALVKDKADHRTQTEAERKAHQEEMIV